MSHSSSMAIEDLRRKTYAMRHPELAETLAHALFYLRCLSGSRNSFTPEVRDAIHKAGAIYMRDPLVEAMHHKAADFIRKNDI